MRQLKGHRATVDAPDAAKYEGMSEGELVQELMKNVAAAKSDGTFSSQQLEEFVRFVSPQLDESSRKRLNELVAMLNNS